MIHSMWFFRCVNMMLTLILGSVNEVHMAMSSLVLMSGYLFLAKRASNSCSCCEVKCVLCLLCRLSLTLFLLLLALMSFVSSSWLSGLTGLWLGSSEAGSETWDFKDDRPSDLQFFFIALLENPCKNGKTLEESLKENNDKWKNWGSWPWEEALNDSWAYKYFISECN